MTGISSSIGLISGINTGQLIEQLLAIEARPKIFAQNRLTQLKAEQGAFLAFNSSLLSLKSSAEAFRKDKIFESKTATSSNTSILTATASISAQPGTYQFLIDRLVSSSQLISRGFVDADSTGIGATNISFEFGKGRVDSEIRLSELNGGSGVARGKIKITDSAGATATIDLSRAVTLDDVIEAINTDGTIKATATVSGDHLEITDGAGGIGELTITNDVGFTTATELGIAASDSDDGQADGVITGGNIVKISGTTALGSLNDGNGVLINSGLGVSDFTITDKNGIVHNIVLGDKDDGNGGITPAVTTLQGVIDRINSDTGGAVTATVAVDGVSLQLDDTTGGGGTLSVGAGPNGDRTIKDLGLTAAAVGNTISGTRLVSGLNSVLLKSLNGGSGLGAATTLDITDRSGAATSINITSASSLQDIIDLVNNDAIVNVTATLNQTGNGIAIADNTGGSSNLIVTNDAAVALQIDTGATGVAADSVAGSSLQLKYVSGASLLSDLNYGRGVGTGTFEITDSEGTISTVTIDSSDKTLQDVIDNINSRLTKVDARINDNGDGIILEPEAGATLTSPIKVIATSGSTAKDLNIIGTASGPDLANNFIDGSYERSITLDATDTVNDIINKVNAEGIPVSATLINDGGSNPFRISFSSQISGKTGDLVIDTTGADLGLTTLTKAQDSVAFFGNSDPANAILITSSSNSINNVIAGVTINLNGTSSTAVELTVASDTDKMVKAVNSLVDDFNSVIDKIASLDRFDPETEQRGVLLGDPTLARVKSQLYRVLQGKADGLNTQFERLVEVGVTVGEGGKLEFDEDRFRQQFENDPTAVQNVFSAYVLSADQSIDLGGGVSTDSDTLLFDSLGVAEQIGQLLNGLTNSVDGTLTTVNKNYDTRIRLQEDRISDFDKRLEVRRTILTKQFAAMESALASLQSQQSALSSFKSIF